MEQRLSWFRSMSAEDRSWVGLVAQSGVAAFVDWVKTRTGAAPRSPWKCSAPAPRELIRSVSLQQTVEMVRVVIDVVESRVSELAAPGGEQQLREAMLRYSREVAFSTGPHLRPSPQKPEEPGMPGWKR